MSEFKVEHWDKDKDGALSKEAMLNKLKQKGCRCIPYTFSPGTFFDTHTHAENKMDCVLSGQMTFTMFGKDIILKAGDTLFVPKNEPHSAKVHDDGPLDFIDATLPN